MLFNSYIFILFFLPAAVLGYYILGMFRQKKGVLIYLIILSFAFYSYYNKSYALILGISILVNYIVFRLLNNEKYRNNSLVRKLITILGIIFDIGLIFYFKYYNFFIENINKMLRVSFDMKSILLPLGISFFTFQQISYIVDSYKGETKDYTFLEYVFFVSFFPQLVAGPIVLHNELIPQIRDEKKWHINWDNMAQGLYMFSTGLFKKVLIADTFGKAVTYGYTNLDSISSLEAGITILSYTIQIYFDFSGYCDMASGIARMFNIILPINFNSPYKATSIIDFWSRWHITLTRFLKQYIYFPLGGSRRGKIRTYVNVLIVFLISGIWHGANWTFIIWGGVHGVANVLNRIFKKSWEKWHIITQYILTFIFVNYAWAIFRAENVTQAVRIIWKSINMQELSLSPGFLAQFQLKEITVIYGCMKHIPILNIIFSINGIVMWMLVGVAMFIAVNCENCQRKQIVYNWRNVFTTCILFIWSVMSLSEISTFLYFNF